MGTTPPRVFHRSFWNYAHLFFVACRCACGLVLILPLYFINFFLLFRLGFLGSITIRIDTLWTQFLPEFSTDHFETMHTCFTRSVNVYALLRLSSHKFYLLFPIFRLKFFQVRLVYIYILRAQLLLDFPLIIWKVCKLVLHRNSNIFVHVDHLHRKKIHVECKEFKPLCDKWRYPGNATITKHSLHESPKEHHENLPI